MTTRRLTAAAALLLGMAAGCSERGEPVSFGPPGRPSPAVPRASVPAAAPPAGLEQPPTGPAARFTVERTVAAAGNTKIAVTDYRGPRSGFTGQVWVWAPPQYFRPENAAKGFPVVIALPGGIGFPANYWYGPDLQLEEDVYQWSGSGKSLPFILVMPVLNPDRQYHDCSDIPGSRKMDTWLTGDVPQLVRENFRTLRTRDGWAFMGSSSGGFCALKSVLKYPDRFKAAIASGPDTAPDSPLWRGNRQAMRADDPGWLARRLIAGGGPPVYLAFQVGSTETYELARVKGFAAQYGRGPVHTRLQIIEGGGHNARSYIRGMADGTMAWFSRYLQAPAP